MCAQASPQNETRIIQGVRYQICPDCQKPLRGTGRTVGGHAIFVTKRFIRNKQIVDFTGQWAALCESVGFRLLHHHKAMLVEQWNEQTLFDGEITKEKRRESFFRRLHRGKFPHLAIDYEDVLCFVKEM